MISSKWEMANFPRKKHFNPQAYEPLAKDKAESSINVRSHHIFPSFRLFLLSHPTSRCHHHQFFCHSSPCWQKEEMWVCDVDLRVIETSLLMGNKRAGARKLFHLTQDTVCLTFRAHSIGQLRHVTVKTLPSGEESEGLFLATKPCCFGYDDAKT